VMQVFSTGVELVRRRQLSSILSKKQGKSKKKLFSNRWRTRIMAELTSAVSPVHEDLRRD